MLETNHADASIGGSACRKDGGGLIGRAIINDQKLKVAEVLRQDACHAFAQVTSAVMDGHDHADEGPHRVHIQLKVQVRHDARS
jgi:hypothetical protein